MIAAVIVLGVVVLTLLYLRDREAKAWASERQLLLERIQHPERVSVQEPGSTLEPLETDGEALALIGTIDYGDDDASR